MKRLLSLILFAMILMNVNAYSESATGTLQEMYAQAELSMATGDYGSAAAQFEALGAYSDASQMAMYCKAIMAAETLGMYDIAVSAFHDLGDFKDSKQMATYYTARGYQAKGDLFDLSDISSVSDDGLSAAKDYYDEAANTFAGLALFKDCLTRMAECQAKSATIEAEQEARLAADNEAIYQQALALEKNEEYPAAINAFGKVKNYKDSEAHIETCQNAIKEGIYQEALLNEENGVYQDAIDAFETIIDYKDSKEHIETCQNAIIDGIYQKALALEANEKYQEAVEVFRTIIEYKDSNEHIIECECQIVLMLEENGEHQEAIKMLESIVACDKKEDLKAALRSTYRLISKTNPWSETSDVYTYNDDGNIEKMERYTKEGNLDCTVEYSLDESGKIISSARKGDMSTNDTKITYEEINHYDEHENIIETITTYHTNNDKSKYEDGMVTTKNYEFEYNEQGDVIREIQYEFGNKVMDNYYEYTYDDNGFIIKAVLTSAYNPANSTIISYTYDAIGLLTEKYYAGSKTVYSYEKIPE